MTILVQLLKELNTALPDCEKQGMQPGASEKKLMEFNKNLKPLALTEELKELYSWHNGSLGQLCPMPVFCFELHTLDESLKQKNNFLIDTELPNNLMPIGDFEGVLFLASLNDVDLIKSKVFRYVIEDGEFLLWHESVEALCRTTIYILGHTAAKGETYNDVRLRFSPNADKY